MGCFDSGGGDISFPGPTAEETQLRKIQLEDALASRELTKQLLPFILKSSGLTTNATPAQTPEDTARIQELTQQITAWDQSPTSNRLATQADQDKRLAELRTLNNKYENPGYRQMTEDELIASMTPLEKLQYDVTKAQGERTLKALNGELPISPAMEKNLSKKEAAMEEYLNRVIGPNWRGSTAGQRMTDVQESNELVREEARRGEISSGTVNLLNEMGFLKNAETTDLSNLEKTTGTYLPLVSTYSSVMAPYQQDRAGQFNADVYNAQNESDSFLTKLMPTLLSGAGAAIGGKYGGVPGAMVGGSIGRSTGSAFRTRG